MLFKSDTLSRIYTKSGTEILLFRFSRLWYALVSKQQYNNPRHIVHIVFQCFGYHEFTRFRKTKTFSGAKVLLFSDIFKRKGLFYIFCGHFRQINTLKAAEAALNFSLVKKMFPQYGVKFSFFFVHKLNKGNEFLFFIVRPKLPKMIPKNLLQSRQKDIPIVRYTIHHKISFPTFIIGQYSTERNALHPLNKI